MGISRKNFHFCSQCATPKQIKTGKDIESETEKKKVY